MSARSSAAVEHAKPRRILVALVLLALALAALTRAAAVGADTGQPIAPDSGAMVLAGSAWVGDKPAPPGTVLVALVGETVCGVTLVSQPAPGLNYRLTVLAAGERPGCGTAGAPVTVMAGGAVAGVRDGVAPRFQAGMVVVDMVIP
jgi:hypothetical protein